MVTGEFVNSCPLLGLGGKCVLNAVTFSVALVGLRSVDGEQNLRIWLKKVLTSGIFKFSSDDGCSVPTF